jgi:hypothetical protein
MEDLLDRIVVRKYLPQWLVFGAVILIIGSSLVWWYAVHLNPYNVYWGMLNNSLSTSSVTKHITQINNGTKLDQYIAVQFGTKNFAYGVTKLTDPTSTVTTESIGTLANDYIRYTNIRTSQTNNSGKHLNFKNVLGRWAKASAANASLQTGSAPFYIQSMIGLSGGNTVPIANLPAKQRQDLLQLIHDSAVFNTSFNDVKKQTVNGRSIYVYNVTIEPVAYVAFEKQFASDVGINALNSVDPENYQNYSPIKVQFLVDARAYRLVGINYSGTSHSETYASYGVPVRQSLPTPTISDAKLQQLLLNAQ